MCLEPAVFELRVLIGQRAGSIFHSIPRELIVSHASVFCRNKEKFWPSLAYISLAESKSVRRVARVTTRFRELSGWLGPGLVPTASVQVAIFVRIANKQAAHVGMCTDITLCVAFT